MAKRMGYKLEEIPDDYDIRKLYMHAYVPAAYTPATPHGLLVFLDNQTIVPPAVKTVLDEDHLILVLTRGAPREPWQQAGYLLDIVYNMQKQYCIDPHRLYFMEWEDHHFTALGVTDIYTGIIILNTFVFPKIQVATNDGSYRSYISDETHKIDASLMAAGRRRPWIIAISPDAAPDDYIRALPVGMAREAFQHVRASVVAKPGANQYANLQTDWLRKSLTFMDGVQKTEAGANIPVFGAPAAAVPKARPATQPAGKSDAARPDPDAPGKLLALAQAYADSGHPDLARAKLTELIQKYPNDPAAEKGRALWEQLKGN